MVTVFHDVLASKEPNTFLIEQLMKSENVVLFMVGVEERRKENQQSMQVVMFFMAMEFYSSASGTCNKGYFQWQAWKNMVMEYLNY